MKKDIPPLPSPHLLQALGAWGEALFCRAGPEPCASHVPGQLGQRALPLPARQPAGVGEAEPPWSACPGEPSAVFSLECAWQQGQGRASLPHLVPPTPSMLQFHSQRAGHDFKLAQPASSWVPKPPMQGGGLLWQSCSLASSHL